MPFWITAALLTLLACLAVLLPLARRRDGAADGADSDLAVYQDQLAELDRDLARGAIDAAEAGEARAEIGRRILKAAGKADVAGARGNGRAGRIVATGDGGRAGRQASVPGKRERPRWLMAGG